MKQYSLDFCDFVHHDNGILEIIVHEGVEITGEMAREFLDAISNMQPKVVAALVNRKNDYSYTFTANIILAKTNLVKYLAVVKYGKLKWPLNGAFSPKIYRIAFFNNIPEATEWLLLKLNE